MTTTIKLVGEYEILYDLQGDGYFIDKDNNTHHLCDYMLVNSEWINRQDLKDIGIDGIDTTSWSTYGVKFNKSNDGVYLFDIKEE